MWSHDCDHTYFLCSIHTFKSHMFTLLITLMHYSRVFTVFLACREQKHEKNSFSWVRTFLLHSVTVSLSQRSYKESFPACYTLRDKLFSWKINEISDMQFNTTIKLKYANLVERNLVLRRCLMAWWGPDLFVYTSSWSSACFFLDAVRGKYSYISHAFHLRVAKN